MTGKINLQEKASQLEELWSPRVIGELDGAYYAKIAKLKGELAWHSHDKEDESFLVIQGQLKIELADQTVHLSEGDFYIVPKGVPHNPVADEECTVLIFEKKETQHMGDVIDDRTRSIEDQLRPL